MQLQNHIGRSRRGLFGFYVSCLWTTIPEGPLLSLAIEATHDKTDSTPALHFVFALRSAQHNKISFHIFAKKKRFRAGLNAATENEFSKVRSGDQTRPSLVHTNQFRERYPLSFTRLFLAALEAAEGHFAVRSVFDGALGKSAACIE